MNDETRTIEERITEEALYVMKNPMTFPKCWDDYKNADVTFVNLRNVAVTVRLRLRLRFAEDWAPRASNVVGGPEYVSGQTLFTSVHEAYVRHLVVCGYITE